MALTRIPKRKDWIVQTLSLSADAGPVALDTRFRGSYMYQVEIVTSLDDAVTFTINTANGTQVISKTTTAATSGEFATPIFFYALTGTPTYTLSGLGSGSATITVVATGRPE